ncbi:exodeoxyribonuclease VII small subunit [Desulfococcus multivorans]|uniref:Exodeoxyribonuclease 7 small subunit n=1 Tax=Desulfococcus multivorans DSM 2059 TaxID=1121405 RepID=S7TR39_DESML|nr:exodeoxyribonuclease VII small subunit [Desulfococcus multivorans]AQV01230.2 exodeoxyribonuclease VII small subunit [Desulfococcus multivorans]EPR39130.1 Exodeoxyribonuclease 7 small subunit [Desulfococcus multivorans DSM 2059]SJZ54233.1 Exodeoxyribonuclease VII small subunit [Desulfococcus multivorans DSM 2059]
MTTKQTFEKAMAQLEDIVRELESGDLTLENAMKKFEEGMKLSRYCSRVLDETEKKITLLMTDEDGNIQEKPLDEGSD